MSDEFFENISKGFFKYVFTSIPAVFRAFFYVYSRMILSVNKQSDIDRNAIIYKVTGKG